MRSLKRAVRPVRRLARTRTSWEEFASRSARRDAFVGKGSFAANRQESVFWQRTAQVFTLIQTGDSQYNNCLLYTSDAADE